MTALTQAKWTSVRASPISRASGEERGGKLFRPNSILGKSAGIKIPLKKRAGSLLPHKGRIILWLNLSSISIRGREEDISSHRRTDWWGFRPPAPPPPPSHNHHSVQSWTPRHRQPLVTDTHLATFDICCLVYTNIGSVHRPMMWWERLSVNT